MPDPKLMLLSMAWSAGLAAVVLLAISWLGRPSLTRSAIGWVLGVGAGFYLGAVVLGIGPRLKLTEDRDRFLLLVLPGAMLAELIAAFPSVPRWVAWLARAAVAALAGPVLLWGSVYLEDLGGPGSRLWTSAEMTQWLGGLAVALLALWALLGLLMHVAPTRSVPLALAGVCAGSAVTILLSGSAINGQLGFPLAGGLVGATAASCLLGMPLGRAKLPLSRELSETARQEPRPAGTAPLRGTATVGVGIVGLFALLVGGRFFAELPSIPAAMLFAAPLLCWLTELPWVRKIEPWLRGTLQVLLVAIPVVFVVHQAREKFQQESEAPSSPGEATTEDYMNFGK